MTGVASVLVEARGVGVRREGRDLLASVDLDVERATVHAIIGPNGAGKSTLVAALLGHAPFTGSIRCHFARGGSIGFVPQRLAIDRGLPLTVVELLALSRQRRPVCLGVSSGVRDRAKTLLSRVGLDGFAGRRLSTLSGGELQRVLFANAIDPEPELLFLDEATSGVDQASVVAIERLVGELRDTGTTTILVSHELRQVRRLADRATWIDVRVRATGTVAEVVGDGPYFPFAGDGSAA